MCVHTHTAHLLPHASQHPVPVIDNNAVFNTRRPAWLPAAPLEYAHPPPPRGWGVCGKVVVQVTPVSWARSGKVCMRMRTAQHWRARKQTIPARMECA